VRSHEVKRKARGRQLRAVVLGLTVLAMLTLSGCTRQIERGWLPTDEGTTNNTARVMQLWNGSWIAALLVGVLVWGLIIWSMVAYRRRSTDTGVPPQVRYHIPLEIMYTVVPLMMVAVLFYYTARDEAVLISTKTTPDLKIGVVAKQWAWDFNYLDEDVYETGTQAQTSGDPQAEATLPEIWLPVGKRVQFELSSRDVIHSFWIPAFLMKMDTIPGLINQFQVVPNVVGTYKGRCAELCGEYHAQMLFTVRVVSEADYQAHIEQLREAGQTGELQTELGRSELTPGESEGSQPGKVLQPRSPQGQSNSSENGNS
jgi:cytochrome c oxidase subunit II